jgi:hypothetical protein
MIKPRSVHNNDKALWERVEKCIKGWRLLERIGEGAAATVGQASTRYAARARTDNIPAATVGQAAGRVYMSMRVGTIAAGALTLYPVRSESENG